MAAELTHAMVSLRHLYTNMINGAVRDTASAKRIAEGILSRAIQELEVLATQQAAQGAEPLFFYRPCRDGLYEGPHHANSVGGKMLRDEKPGEWKPLYPSPPPTTEVEDAITSYLEARDALDNREYAGINGEPWDVLQRRVHAARKDLDAALQSEAQTGKPGGSHEAMAELNQAREQGLKARGG